MRNLKENSERIHIVFVGKKNVGKSSLINAFAGQVYTHTTEFSDSTEAYAIPVDLLPFGPVLLIDTPDIDSSDVHKTGNITQAFKSIASADFAIVVIDATLSLRDDEKELLKFLDRISVPYLIAANKIENGVSSVLLKELKQLKKSHFEISCKENAGINELKSKVTRLLPQELTKPLFGDLVNQGDTILMIVPPNLGPPRGALVVPQIQAIREALNEDAMIVVAKDADIRSVLNGLRYEPQLVITDSESVTKVAADIPENIKLTTFSILLARYKGDLSVFVRGIKRINELMDGDKVLIAEACVKHNPEDTTAREKIPNWIRQHTGKDIQFDVVSNENYPVNILDYRLIVHCTGCNLSRHIMQTRVKHAVLLQIPIVNYGILISYLQGAFPRVILPFPEALSEWKKRSQHAKVMV